MRVTRAGHDRATMRTRGLVLLAALVASAAALSVWAALATLVRQEERAIADGSRVLVCIYAAPGGREIERTYPLGNFCPQYTDG